jgi:hypothetical protein
MIAVMSMESAVSRNENECGLGKLRARIGHYAALGVDVVIHGSPNLYMQGRIEPRAPTRPSFGHY